MAACNCFCYGELCRWGCELVTYLQTVAMVIASCLQSGWWHLFDVKLGQCSVPNTCVLHFVCSCFKPLPRHMHVFGHFNAGVVHKHCMRRALHLQALGRACHDLDPELRPTFKQAVQQLQSMIAQSQAANSGPGSEATAQIREYVDASAIPDVVTCTTQAVQYTEMDLTPAVQTAAAASG